MRDTFRSPAGLKVSRMFSDCPAGRLRPRGSTGAAEYCYSVQIAGRLVLSHRTVQNHVQDTLGKLQLHNRAELVR
jgi:hypothetical protein